MKSSITTVALLTAVAGLSITAAAPARTNDAGKLFGAGTKLCSLIDLTAMDKAVGVKFPKPVMSGTACFFETGKFGDLNRTIVRVSTKPGLPKSAVDATVALEKKAGAKDTPEKLPGASEAIVSASTFGGTVNETLYGVYPQGELVVSLTGKKLTPAQALAAAKVATS